MKINKWLIILFVAAAVIGFADSAYLTAEHVRGVIPPCGLLDNCEKVLSSPYATIWTVPVSAFGIFYYGAILVLMIAYLDTWNRRILRWACWLVGVGLLASLYFVSVQAFIIRAWCPYCLLSVFTTLCMTAIAVQIMRTD